MVPGSWSQVLSDEPGFWSLVNPISGPCLAWSLILGSWSPVDLVNLVPGEPGSYFLVPGEPGP